MDEQQRGQVVRSAAEVYEEFFVPALFAEWAPRVVEAARVEQGDRVLDVGCGTGVVARHAAERTGSAEAVAGIDVNDGMLEVARRLAPEIQWHHGQAEALPFTDGMFDAVISQFSAMFFEDRVRAVREMTRVARMGGRVAVAVWGPLEDAPGYAGLVTILGQMFGERAEAALRAPFVLGDSTELAAIFREAEVPSVEIETEMGTARFPSIRSWMHTDVRGWTLAEMIDDQQFAHLVGRAKHELARYVDEDGVVTFDMPAHVAVANI